MHTYVVLLGLPGAGKGTQARRLVDSFGLYWISTGDILRRIALEEHDLAQRVKSIMESGRLVDDETVYEVVQHYLESEESRYPGVILDGFPRNLRQGEMLENYLETIHHEKGLHAVYFDMEPERVVRRLTARRVCPGCQRVYNQESHPSSMGDLCEACGEPLIQRADDAEAVVRKRIQTYLEETRPLVDYYERLAKLVKVPADDTETVVYKRLAALVERWLHSDSETLRL